MLKFFLKTVCITIVFAMSSGAFAEKGEPWLTDLDKAQRVAKAKDKDIFVYFTGSDWCAPCMKLDKDVLSKPEFLAYAKENLVLVELDFPQDEDTITKEQRAHNEKWHGVFQPIGFPQIYLTDASAKVYAKTGYRPGGPVEYVEHLKTLRAGKEAIVNLQKSIQAASGLERANLLDKLLSNEVAAVEYRAAKVSEIITLTKNKDEALYNKYRAIQGSKRMMMENSAVSDSAVNDEEKLRKRLTIYEKYSYIKDGDELYMFLQELSYQFLDAGKASEGFKFFTEKSQDKSYPLEFRQILATMKAIQAAVANNDKELGKALLQEAMDMAPESKTGQSHKTFLFIFDKVMTETQESNP